MLRTAEELMLHRLENDSDNQENENSSVNKAQSKQNDSDIQEIENTSSNKTQTKKKGTEKSGK